MKRLALIAVALALTIAAPARADLPVGQLTLISCTLPDNTPTGMAGWVYDQGTASGDTIFKGDHCDGTFDGRQDANQFARGFGTWAGAYNSPQTSTPSSTTSWTYTAPAATVLVGGSVIWSGEIKGTTSYRGTARIDLQSDTSDGSARTVMSYDYATPGDPDSYEPVFKWGGGDTDYNAGTNDAIATPLTGRVSHRKLALVNTCVANPPNGAPANSSCYSHFYARRVYLTLADGSKPTGNATGSLTAATTLQGTVEGAVSAADTGVACSTAS